MGSDFPRRIVALDVGTKRVGMAMSDPLGLFAQPVGTFEPGAALQELKRLAAGDGIAVAVVGWPLTEDGKEGKATAMVNVYVRRIRKAVRGIRVVRQDERFTSEEARTQLTGKDRKARIDTMAAGIILQEYLDNHPGVLPERGNVSPS